MALPVLILGVPHNPFHHRSVSFPRANWPHDTVRRVEKAAKLREHLRSAEPDTLLMIGNDHFHHLFMGNMPAFLVGQMDVFDITYYNEVREFALPQRTVPGNPELARQILWAGLSGGIDFAFSNELKLDHSFLVPLMLLRPEFDLPIVPILTNCIAPPLPSAERFFVVGQMLRAILDGLPNKQRIAVIVTGHLALDVGGPYQGRPPGDSFSQEAVRWVAEGTLAEHLHECTYERLLAAGNQTPGFLNFVLGAGLAGGKPATYTELQDLGAEDLQGFFAWDPANASVR